MIQLEFLGAMATVGASGFLVDTGAEKIVFDYGVKVQNEDATSRGQQLFPLPVSGKVDAICLSHCHLDHSGAIPVLFSKGNNCPVYAVDATKPLTELLLHDSLKISKEEGTMLPFTSSNVKQALRNFSAVEYRRPVRVHTSTIVNYDAGHIPGSMMTMMSTGGKNILYTGDFNTNDTRLIRRADTRLPKIDALVTECTYADRDHKDRKQEEKTLVSMVNDTVANNGVAVIPCFAVGRAQELLLILDKYGIDYSLYMDGMAKKATTIINRMTGRFSDSKALDRALEKVKYVGSQRERSKIIKQPCVVLTTSGMLNGGPVNWYLRQLFNDRNSALLLSGYQVEGTPGRTLLETGRFITEDVNLEVRMLIKRFDFSSHLGRVQLLEFIEQTHPEHIFCVHGDHTEEFANELQGKGFNAVAPIANNRVFSI